MQGKYIYAMQQRDIAERRHVCVGGVLPEVFGMTVEECGFTNGDELL